jgi:hypothetical protein
MAVLGQLFGKSVIGDKKVTYTQWTEGAIKNAVKNVMGKNVSIKLHQSCSEFQTIPLKNVLQLFS